MGRRVRMIINNIVHINEIYHPATLGSSSIRAIDGSISFPAQFRQSLQITLDSGHVNRSNGGSPDVDAVLHAGVLGRQFGELVLIHIEPHAHIVIDESELAGELDSGLEFDVDHALVLDEGSEVGEEQTLSNRWGTDLVMLLILL